MAYLRELKIGCQFYACTKTAVVELISRFNSPMGHYCRQHGEWKHRELAESEAKNPVRR